MLSNKINFVKFAGTASLVSCLVSSSSFAQGDDPIAKTTSTDTAENNKMFVGSDDIDKCIGDCANENNNTGFEKSIEENSAKNSVEGDSKESSTEINKLQDSIYFEKDSYEDSSKEKKFIYLKNDDENKDFYAKSDQVNSKEKTYSDAVKYSSISSKDYEVIPDSIKYGSVSSEKGFEENKKYRESDLATNPVVICIIGAAVAGLLFYGFYRLLDAWVYNTFGRGNLLAMERALQSKNCKLYLNGKLLKWENLRIATS